MKANDILVEEHRVILKVLDVLEKISDEAEKNGKLNSAAAKKSIDFIRNFADRTHHSKEEDRLFVVMEEHGFPREGGPTGVMLMEHTQGREYVKKMDENIEAASNGDENAIKEFSNSARGYVNLLRQHIDKEDHCLYPMAEQGMPGNVKDDLLADFKRIEKEAGGKRHSKYISLAGELCSQYGIPPVDESLLTTIQTELST